MTTTLVCPKCGYNLFYQNEDNDDVCVRCGMVSYNSPISDLKPTRERMREKRREIKAEAKIRYDRDKWGVQRLIDYFGISKTTAYRWLREWPTVTEQVG